MKQLDRSTKASQSVVYQNRKSQQFYNSTEKVSCIAVSIYVGVVKI
jgi:hypothetical protein